MPSVLKARAEDHADVFGAARPCAIDPSALPMRHGRRHNDAYLRNALEETGDLDPALTVVHICTPPAERTRALETLARFGFRKFIVEKPLAVSIEELEWLNGLVGSYELDIGVAMPWLSSRVTLRLERQLNESGNGQLRRIESIQDKPRFARSLRKADHPSAFDVELPHALGVVTHLAGPARAVVSAGCVDLEHEFGAIPNLGAACLKTLHVGGVVAEMGSNLGAPLRQRFVRLHLDSTVVTGFYSISGDDPYAQVIVETLADGATHRELFIDDPFPRMISDWYRYFAGIRARPLSDVMLNAAVVRTLSQAKARAGLQTNPTRFPGEELVSAA